VLLDGYVRVSQVGTSTGRLVLRMMLSLAEFELDRIRDSWRESAAKAIERGVHICPLPPAGYARGPEGRLALDPVDAPYIRAGFERRAMARPEVDLPLAGTRGRSDRQRQCRLAQQLPGQHLAQPRLPG
jgi:DNA invertase Pin-like site-specific DNA recombinase